MQDARWEYNVETFDSSSGFFSVGGEFDTDRIQERLNKLGSDGWELVSMMDTNLSGGISRYIYATFKRPIR